MTLAGVTLLVGFAVFAVLMIIRVLPTILALPIMAAWISFIVGIPFFQWIYEILLKGSFRLSIPMALVIFGALFAEIIQKTGISNAVVKKSAELSDDQPIAIALLMTAATAFVFMGMTGLGAIIMIGSIAIPIMTSAGIEPIDAAILILLGMLTGSSLNFASMASSIGIFGSDAVLKYFLPNAVISLLLTVVYIYFNIPRRQGTDSSVLIFLKDLLLGLLTIPLDLLRQSTGIFKQRPPSTLTKKKHTLPNAALIAPLMPLLVIAIIQLTVGLGDMKAGKIDPIAAAVLGFLLAAVYAALVTRPTQIINLFTGALLDGIRNTAGVLFLFMGIGMLVTAATHPAAVALLNPLIRAVMPSSFTGVLIFFTLLAPTALYRGPFNMYGMGSGIATILISLNILPASALYGMFAGVGYLQAIADPTNSQNSWLAGYAKVDVNAIMKKILPYAWAACVLMMLTVAYLR